MATKGRYSSCEVNVSKNAAAILLTTVFLTTFLPLILAINLDYASMHFRPTLLSKTTRHYNTSRNQHILPIVTSSEIKQENDTNAAQMTHKLQSKRAVRYIPSIPYISSNLLTKRDIKETLRQNKTDNPTTPESDEETALHDGVDNTKSIQIERISNRQHCIFSNDSQSGYQLNCDDINDINSVLSETMLDGVVFFSVVGNNLSTLPTITKPVPELKTLILKNNAIRKIGKSWFKNFPDLEVLDLSINELSSLYFPEANSLKILDVSFNKLQNFHTKPLTISYLNMSNNCLDNLSFVINMSYVIHLNVSRNKISFISPDSLKHLTQLEELDLSFNQIVETEFLSHITSLKMSILYLSNNAIKRIDVKGIKSLKDLYLDFNAISEFNFTSIPEHLDTLNLSSNRLVHVNKHPGRNSDIVFLYLANNSLNTVTFLKHMTNLKTIDLSYNDLRHIDDIVLRNNKVRLELKETHINSIDFALRNDLLELNIENNNITCFPQQFFRKSKNLKNFYVAKNPLANLICPVSLESNRLIHHCNRSAQIQKWEISIEVHMRDSSINEVMKCMLRERGKRVLPTCYQKFCSGVNTRQIAYMLQIFTNIFLILLSQNLL